MAIYIVFGLKLTILKGTDHVIIGGNDHTLVTEEVTDAHGLQENQLLSIFIRIIGLMLFVCLEKMGFIITVIYHHLSCPMKKR